jgi:hypothetical protein
VKYVSAVIQGDTLDYVKQSETVTEVVGKGMRMVEVPPGFGILRACAGGDCSTAYSFPFPNDPNEHVFFIYDSDGRVKGYLEGTILESNGKKSFYLNTINGPRISSGDTRALIQGVFENLKELGATQLVLPEESKLDVLINFEPIKSVFREVIQGRTSCDLKYYDSSFRATLEEFKSEFNNKKDEHRITNTKGHVFAPNEGEILALEIKSAQAAPLKFFPKISKIDLVDLALDFHHLSQPQAIEIISQIGKLDRKKLDELLAVIDNADGAPVAEYDKRIGAALKRVGLDDNLRSQREYLFWEGYLKCSDAYSPQNRHRAITYLFKKYRMNPNVEVLKKLAEYADEAHFHPYYKKIYKPFIRPGRVDLKALDFLNKYVRIPFDKEELLALTKFVYIENAYYWREAQELIKGSSLRDMDLLREFARGMNHPGVKYRGKFFELVNAHYSDTPEGLAYLTQAYFSGDAAKAFYAKEGIARSEIAELVDDRHWGGLKEFSAQAQAQGIVEGFERISGTYPNDPRLRQALEILRDDPDRPELTDEVNRLLGESKAAKAILRRDCLLKDLDASIGKHSESNH